MALFDLVQVCPKCKKAVACGWGRNCPSCGTQVLPYYYENGTAHEATELPKKWKSKSQEEKDAFVRFILEHQSKEHRMICNLCGTIYCFTDEDIRKNKKNQQLEQQKRNSAILDALAGTQIQSDLSSAAADRYKALIVDYDRCPKCNSTDVRELDENEYETEKAKQNNTPPQVSVVDELKQYKELLDSGIITQEEFDAKKMQVLGLPSQSAFTPSHIPSTTSPISIEKGEAVVPICEENNGIIKCPKCGTEQKSGRSVCFRCGTSFTQQ